jgi:Ran GTPase-activating protein (RanGAP) involved in mRNA processing and transport
LPLVKGLKNLDVGGNNIGPEGVASLIRSLKVRAELTLFPMSQQHNWFTFKCVFGQGHESLESLELGYNPLGAKGTKILTDVAKFDLPKLETLKLGWCKLGVEGSRSISELLVMNSTLRSLDLRGNELGNDGAIILGRGLKSVGGSNPAAGAGGAAQQQLKELDLGYNEIKDDGACAIAQALKANADAAPRELKLNSNYITRFGQVALSEAVDMVYEMSKGRTTTTVHF